MTTRNRTKTVLILATVTLLLIHPASAATVDTTLGATLDFDDPANTYIGNGTLTVSGDADSTIWLATGSGTNVTNFQMTSGGTIDIQGGVTFKNGGWQKGVWTSNLSSLNVAGTFDIWDGNHVYVDALSGGGTVTKGHPGNSPTVLNVGVNNGGNTFGGTIENPSGTLALTKTGGGSQTLTGVSTYAGATTISGGTLKLSAPTTTNPGTLAGLQSWFDASAITGLSDGDQISQWNDLSGNNRHATQANAGNQPVYTVNPLVGGRPVANFWNPDIMDTDFSYLTGSDYTILAVDGRTTTGSNAYYLGTTPGATNRGLHFGYRNNTTFTLAQYANDLDASVVGYQGQSFRLWTGWLDTASGHYVNVNGVSAASNTNTTGFSTSTGGRIGRGTSGQFYGDLAEILIFDRALTASERQQMEQYLMGKWLGVLPSTTAVNLSASGTTLDLNGVNQNIGSLTGVAGSQVLLNGGSLTIGNDNTSTTFSGVIADGTVGGGTVSKTGGGALTLDGSSSNTYTGQTVLVGGKLGLAKTGGAYAVPGDFVGINHASPDVYATQDNQFAPGSVMYFQGNQGDHVRFELLGTTQTLAGIDNTGAGGRGVIQHEEHSNVAQVDGLSTLKLNGAGNYYFDGYLRNTGGQVELIKDGAGTQTLAGTRIDYTGSTTVTDGKLRFLNLDDLHSSTLTIATNATAEFENSTRTFNRFSATSIEGDGTFVKTGTGLLRTGNATNQFAHWNMTGGLIDVQQGEFRADYQNQAVAWVNNKASMNVDAGAFVSMVGGNHITVDALTGQGTVQNINSWGTGIFTVGSNNGSGLFGGILRDNGGPLAFTKIGTGTQTLSGTNTYTGTTTVSQGTLLVNGSHTGGGAYSVTGGTLGGSGSIGADVEIQNGAFLSPGVSPGTLTVRGDLTLDNGSTFVWELGSTLFDQQIVSGAGNVLTLEPGWIFQLVDFNGAQPTGPLDEFLVFELQDGATLASLEQPAMWDISLVEGLPRWFTHDSLFNPALIIGEDGNVYLIGLLVAPEPSTFLLATLGLLSLGCIGWRRRRRS